MPLQKLFRENLAAFELGRLLRRPYDGPISLAKRVRQPVDKRQFRSHDGQMGFDLSRQRDDGADVTGVDGHALRFRRDAAITGSAPDFFHPRALS